MYKLWTRLMPLILMVCPSFYAAEKSLSVHVSLPQGAYLPGEPILAHIALVNRSSTALTYIGTKPSDAFRANAWLISREGEKMGCGGETETFIGPRPGVTSPKVILDPGQVVSLECPVNFACLAWRNMTPGQYMLDVEIVGNCEEQPLYWKRLALDSLQVEIRSPAGEDRAYLDDLERAIADRDPKNLKGGTLQQRPLEWGEVLHTYRAKAEALCLSKHPTSTYAAYVVYECMRGYFRNNWRMLANDIGRPYSGNRSLPDDTGQWKDGWQILTFDQEMAWWDKWIGIILKHHPDIWFADELKLKRAINLVAQKKYDAGAEDLQVLARDAKEPVAGAAKEFLGIMEEKGWIKAAPLVPQPPATQAPDKAAPAPPASPAPTKSPVGGS